MFQHRQVYQRAPVFQIGKERITHDVAAKWSATRWYGIHIGDPEIVVWGPRVELCTQDCSHALRDRLLHNHLLPPALVFPNQNLDRFVAETKRFWPCMLFGYPSLLASVAKHRKCWSLNSGLP